MLVGFNVTVQGERQVDFAFVRMEGGLGDLEQPLNAIGDQLIGAIREQFETEGRRAGGWTPLSDAYRRWKEQHYPGRPILVRTGGSKGAALDRLQALMVTGNRLVYEPPGVAAEILGRHQAGEGRLPQRKVIDLLGGDGRGFERTLAHWVRHLDGRAEWPPA